MVVLLRRQAGLRGLRRRQHLARCGLRGIKALREAEINQSRRLWRDKLAIGCKGIIALQHTRSHRMLRVPLSCIAESRSARQAVPFYKVHLEQVVALEDDTWESAYLAIIIGF